MIESILNKYPEKVVLIDLWATWCSPCLAAIDEFKTAKRSFSGKDVVFVYLTNASFPQTIWKNKIEGIGNEHYYLNDKQWEYVMNNFEFESIPSYLLYNKRQELINKFTAFPGAEQMKKMIDEQL